MSIKRTIIDHIKNIEGFRTRRKLVVFAVDDYGNVRIDSKTARDRMIASGLKLNNRFDQFDTLETKEDLEALFDVLSTVKDKNGRNAIFTSFAVPCNIDFEKMAAEGYLNYHYELLPETFNKLASYHPRAYEGAWKLWQEGLKDGFLSPQFHGREHLNLKVFSEKLRKKDQDLIISLANRSNAGIANTGYKSIGYTAAFDFWEFSENETFIPIIINGLEKFPVVFGKKANHFNAPGASEHHILHKTLAENGILYVDAPWIKNEHQGLSKYRRSLNFTGKTTQDKLTTLVRNVVFEPTANLSGDWVSYTLKQIETSFRMRKPAIISSHRVNFCGHIDPKNREKGLSALKGLLNNIVKHWPDVEFMASKELGNLIIEKGNIN